MLEGVPHQLLFLGEMQLLENVAGVILDGLGRDEQLPADLAVGAPLGHMLQCLTLSFGKGTGRLVGRLEPSELGRHERHRRRETTHHEEQRHHLERPGDPRHTRCVFERVPGPQLPRGVEADGNGCPVSERHGEHGQRPVGVDRSIAIDLGRAGQVGETRRRWGGRLRRWCCSDGHTPTETDWALSVCWGNPPYRRGGAPNDEDVGGSQRPEPATWH